MDSLIKWVGPGALVGGLGAAMLCGAGQAGADTGADGGPGQRAAQPSASAPGASAPGASKGGAEKGARKPRSASAGTASVRVADAPDATLSPAALTAPSSRDSAAAVVLRTSDNKSPVASVQRPAAAAVSDARAIPAVRNAVATVPAPAAAIPAAAAVPASTPAPAAAAAATSPVMASSIPVDPAQFAGTYYEQGSVKQFFSIGLVNTKAVYTAKPDGTLGVRNSGNYFFKRGPKSSITGSAVPVNAINTALNVGFGGFGGAPSAKPPGNYLIVDRAPDYSWAIVSDPSGRSGFILTRSQTIDPKAYQELLAKARALGVQGRITPTRQFP